METKASAKKIWLLWTDVENWNKWDVSVEYSKINGTFDNGVSGTLKTVNGPKSKFCLKNIVVDKSFTSQLKLPLCTVDFVHELVNENSVLKIKHSIKIYGALTCIFKNVIGKNAAKDLPAAVKNLADMAEAG